MMTMTPCEDQALCGGVQTTELAPGYTIPKVILGGWQLSKGHALGAALDNDAVERAFLTLKAGGLNTFDGADIYTGVEDFYGSLTAMERAAGRAIPQVHTKFVPDLNDLAKVDYAYVERVITRSCRRLQRETLDLVQFHWWDYDVPGMVDVAGYLVDLQNKGLIRHIGTTNFNAEQLERLLKAGIPVVSNQCQYSILDRRPAKHLVGLCERYGVKLLCYGTVAGGFLFERYLGVARPSESENRSLVKYALVIEDTLGWDGFQALLRKMDEIAKAKGISISELATLYTLSRTGVAAAIVGVRNDRHLAETLRLASSTLTSEEIRQLEALTEGVADLPGDAFDIERDPESAHRKIMRMNLVNSVTGS